MSTSPQIHHTSKGKTFLTAFSFWAVFMIVLSGISIPFAGLVPAQYKSTGTAFFGMIAALVTTFIFLKIDKQTFRSIGLFWEKKTLLRFAGGLVIGGLIFTIVLSVILSSAGLHLKTNPAPFQAASLIMYLTLIPLALFEEIAFRSYPFLKLQKGFNLLITQFIIAILFAAYHIILGWDVQTAILGPGIWAFVFGLGAVWSGGIALPTGIHVALNVAQNIVGLKSMNNALWFVDYKSGVQEDLLAKADVAGLATQIATLVISLILTVFLIRKKKTRTTN